MPPTILHVTHPKSGSTWITDILHRIGGDRFVPAIPELGHVSEPLEPGSIYPRVYATRELVEGWEAPDGVEILLSIRDLRDTLISAYWSLRDTHDALPLVGHYRDNLRARSLEDGLIWLMDEWAPRYAAEMQRSWADSPLLLRYEDIVADDVGVLVPELSERLGIAPPERVEAAVRALRFEATSGGRARGTEDRSSHYRKGIAGDWRNYMAEGPVRDAFKERYAELLVATGYETGTDW